MKNLFILPLLIILSCNHKSSDSINKQYICGDEQKVLEIAEKEWLRIYGKEIYDSKPFVAQLKNDSIWVVKGTLPKGYDGGVPYAEINAKTCKTIKVIHGK